MSARKRDGGIAGRKRKPTSTSSSSLPSSASSVGKKSRIKDDFLIASDEDDDHRSNINGDIDEDDILLDNRKNQKSKRSENDTDATTSTIASAVLEEEHDLYEKETPEERRLRLAKEYLQKIKLDHLEKRRDDDDGIEKNHGDADQEEEEDDEDIEDVISHRLIQDVKKARGLSYNPVAHHYSNLTYDSSCLRVYRGHQLSVTCCALTADDRTIYSAGKDCTIIKYDVETGHKTMYRGARNRPEIKGHKSQIWSISVSSDGNLLASGGMEKSIYIWDTRSNNLIKTLKGHRDSIMSLSFRKDSHTLYSTSKDRTIKIWNCDNMEYMDTLFGHESDITCIDSLYRERAVTVSRDCTARYWKIPEETQLLFKASPHSGSIDTCALLNEERFITGSQDSTLNMWTSTKKKPIASIVNAHQGSWITSVAALPFSDIAFSGSHDGHVAMWRIEGAKSGGGGGGGVLGADKLQAQRACGDRLVEMTRIPIAGFINGMCVASSGRFMVAAVGQEHRLGRWWRIAQARNSIQIVDLTKGKPTPTSNTVHTNST